MAYSSILGADHAPEQPSGRDSNALGPSDNSDSGSDAVGTSEIHGDSDAAGTGERGSVMPGEIQEGADLLPDHVVRLRTQEDREGEAEDADETLAGGEGFPAADVDAQEFTDLDAKDPDANETGEDSA